MEDVRSFTTFSTSPEKRLQQKMSTPGATPHTGRLACEICRKAKVKCDLSGGGACVRCTQKGFECIARPVTAAENEAYKQHRALTARQTAEFTLHSQRETRGVRVAGQESHTLPRRSRAVSYRDVTPEWAEEEACEGEGGYSSRMNPRKASTGGSAVPDVLSSGESALGTPLSAETLYDSDSDVAEATQHYENNDHVSLKMLLSPSNAKRKAVAEDQGHQQLTEEIGHTHRDPNPVKGELPQKANKRTKLLSEDEPTPMPDEDRASEQVDVNTFRHADGPEAYDSHAAEEPQLSYLSESLPCFNTPYHFDQSPSLVSDRSGESDTECDVLEKHICEADIADVLPSSLLPCENNHWSDFDQLQYGGSQVVEHLNYCDWVEDWDSDFKNITRR